MKNVLMMVLCTLALCAGMQDPGAADRKAVERAVLDYVEAFYQTDYSLIEKSVHSDVKKLGFYRNQPGLPYTMNQFTFGNLISASNSYNKDGHLAADAPKKVEVYDVQDQTAAAKLTAEWGVDYLHLAKYDGRWKIVQILWQTVSE